MSGLRRGGWLGSTAPHRADSLPTSNGGMRKRKLSCGILHASFGADSHAQSVLSDKNFCIGAQSEELIKGASRCRLGAHPS